MEHEHDGLGCCGYDELGEKPATTQPFRFRKPRDIHAAPKSEGGLVTRRIPLLGSSQARYPIVNLDGRF